VEYLKHNDLHAHPGICGKGPVVIPWEVIRFTSLQRLATVRFWIIPRTFCPSSTLVMTAENQLDASAENEFQEFPVCVFTQPEAAHIQMAIATGPNSSSAIRYYSASMHSAQSCQDSRRCEFRSLQPFFGLISGIAPEGNFSMRISYRVQARANRDFRCTMRSLPRITERGIAFTRSGVGDISVLCTSASDELMNRIVSLLLTILVTTGVLFVIHCMGVVNLFKVIGCGLASRPFAENYLTLGTTISTDGL
jgi:hypothetical protein